MDMNMQDINVKPLSHQTAMPQRLYSVLKPRQRAVESPRNTPKISNLSVIACTQRHHSVPTAPTRRSHSVHDVFTACKQLLQRAHSAHTTHTAFSRRAHTVLTAIIAFKMFYLVYFLFGVTVFANIVIYFYFSKQIVTGFNSL